MAQILIGFGWAFGKISVDKNIRLDLFSPADLSGIPTYPAESFSISGRENLRKLRNAIDEALILREE